MTPTLSPGDYVVITKARALRPGFVVLVDHPKFGIIVKRIRSLQNDGVVLEGDSPQSTTSDSMGVIPQDRLMGRARLAITQTGLKRL